MAAHTLSRNAAEFCRANKVASCELFRNVDNKLDGTAWCRCTPVCRYANLRSGRERPDMSLHVNC
jgi:hypothetical protein